jgi:UPF0755 protein
MDSTIVYEFTNGNPKNMRSIKQSDLEKNTKYNTRKFSGLPPSAIGNPGKLAIEAALNPEKTDFYFLLQMDLVVTFLPKLFSEHNKNVAKNGVKLKILNHRCFQSLFSLIIFSNVFILISTFEYFH